MDDTEDFQDFTTATAWERFIADVEAVFREWQQDKGGQAVSQVELGHSMTFRLGTYRMTYHRALESQASGPNAGLRTPQVESTGLRQSANSDRSEDGMALPLKEERNKLQSMFGVRSCIILAPTSYSGRFMNDQEARTILSALSITVVKCKMEAPCFLPVNSSLRDVFWGVGLYKGQYITNYDSDSLRDFNPSARLLTPRGQIGLFAEQLRARSPDASASCLASELASESQTPMSHQSLFHPTIQLRQTFVVPFSGASAHGSDAEGEHDGPALWSEKWDEDAAWWPWASPPDPCSHLELDVVWEDLPIYSEIIPPTGSHGKSCWRLHALAQHRTAWSLPAFFQSNSGTDRPQASRRRLRLALPSQDSSPRATKLPRMDGSFSAMISALCQASSTVSEADTLGQLAGVDFWTSRGYPCPSIPSDSVMRDVLRDLFKSPRLPAAFLSGANDFNDSLAPELRPSLAGPKLMEGLSRCAPADSLASRLSLHAMTFSNPRAVALLWTSFLRELRFAHWERGVSIPRQHAPKENGEEVLPDLRYTLMHQKLQMLDLCIKRRNSQTTQKLDLGSFQSHEQRTGIVGVIEGQYLVAFPSEPVYEPVTQPASASTEDMLLEEGIALNALGSSQLDESARGRKQGRLLSSDMAAFKAANPKADLRDFVKWHSPKDWLTAGDSAQGHISKRIGGIWKELWENAKACPVHEQAPLMDPELEGERALHWFENLASPSEIWQILVAVALSTALACLSGSQACTLSLVATELLWFYDHASKVLSSMGDGTITADLLEKFQMLERLVVSAQSLMQRLPGQSGLIERLLQCCHSGQSGHDGIALTTTERAHLEEVMSSAQGENATGYLGNDQNVKLNGQQDWPSEMQREWILELKAQDMSRELYHRMYTCIRSEEIRVGTLVMLDY